MKLRRCARLVRARVPRLYQDQSLDVALRFLKDRPMLPVVHRGKLDLLMGVVSVEDILRRLPQEPGWPNRRQQKFLNWRRRRTPDRTKLRPMEQSCGIRCGGTDMLKLETLRSAHELDRLRSRWSGWRSSATALSSNRMS